MLPKLLALTSFTIFPAFSSFALFIMYGWAAINWLGENNRRRPVLADYSCGGVLLLPQTNLPAWEEPNVYIRLADQFAELPGGLARLVGEDEVVRP